MILSAVNKICQIILKRISLGGILVVLLVLSSGPDVRGEGGDEAVRAYFSPSGKCEETIIEEIEKAKTYIHIAMFHFTNGRIARALVKVSRQGTKTKVIMDEMRASDIYSKSRFLKSKGVNVKLMKGPYRENKGSKTGLMHNKFAVIDGKRVITGSYNWTNSAEKWNYENLLIISSRQVAEFFEREFTRLWTEQ